MSAKEILAELKAEKGRALTNADVDVLMREGTVDDMLEAALLAHPGPNSHRLMAYRKEITGVKTY